MNKLILVCLAMLPTLACAAPDAVHLAPVNNNQWAQYGEFAQALAQARRGVAMAPNQQARRLNFEERELEVDRAGLLLDMEPNGNNNAHQLWRAGLNVQCADMRAHIARERAEAAARRAHEAGVDPLRNQNNGAAPQQNNIQARAQWHPAWWMLGGAVVAGVVYKLAQWSGLVGKQEEKPSVAKG